jgi:hypothetical protein
MNYLDAINVKITPSKPDHTLSSALIKNNYVRQQLEMMGYKTIAFETGYAWNHWNNADLFLSPAGNPLTSEVMQPFEEMLIRSTLLRVVADNNEDFLVDPSSDITVTHHKELVRRTRFIMNWLDELPDLGAPKLVYAHINIPHVPFVFLPDGTVTNEKKYYRGQQDYPMDEEHFVNGYRNQVEFLNSRMPGIIRNIIDRSKVPPIIIVQGDHGIRDDNRFEILNLYRFPGVESQLYPSITPVNSFRVLLNSYFNGSYPNLDDHSYVSTSELPYDVTEVFETSERCKAK